MTKALKAVLYEMALEHTEKRVRDLKNAVRDGKALMDWHGEHRKPVWDSDRLATQRQLAKDKEELAKWRKLLKGLKS